MSSVNIIKGLNAWNQQGHNQFYGDSKGIYNVNKCFWAFISSWKC